MEGYLFRAYLAAALTALAVYVAMPAGALRELVWQVFVWGGVVALVAGTRTHRPDLRGPWHVITVGLALLALGGTVNLPWWPGESEEVRRLLGDLASLVGYPMIGVGAAWFARAQSGGRDHGPVLDSIIVTIALTTVLWEGVFVLHGGAGGMEPSSLAALLVLSFSASWVAAMSIRLILAGAYRAPSGWLVFGATIAGLAGAVAFLLTGGQGRLITGGPTDLLWAAAVLLVAGAATHPSMTILTRPADGIEAATVWARVLLPALALAAPPAAVLARQVTTGQTATVAAGASVVIAAVVVLRFADLVRGRERARHELLARAARQSALARLGEGGLAGTEPRELVAAAQAVLCTELGDPDLRLLMTDDDPGSGGELPGSRGLVRLRNASGLELSADTEDFLASVGHVLASAVNRQRDEEELRHRSLHDPLTGLANRTLLGDRVQQGMERRHGPGRGLALVFVDLDGFKTVNDTYGHAVGDALLCAVGQRLCGCVRGADTVARFAGDEFVVVLDDVDAATATELAGRILSELRLPIEVGGRVLAVTASIGLALATGDRRTPEELLWHADAAMYRSKQEGRDRVVHVGLDGHRSTSTG